MDKLSRTIQRFQAKIDSGSFYEAHQTLRTITNRYVKSKQFKEARDLLYQGCTILIKNKEYASASDLINYLIEIYEEESITIEDKDAKFKLIELISQLPNNDPSLNDLAKHSITWSTKNSKQFEKFGDNDLHHLFGSKFLKHLEENSNEIDSEQRVKIFAIAELHLVLGTSQSVPLYINYLLECSKANSNEDPGVFISRAVINYAYLKNINFIKESIDLFLKGIDNGEEIKGMKFYDQYPLLNFVQLLTLTLQVEPQSNSAKFTKLYSQYKPILVKYEIISSVDYLASLYFKLNLGNTNQQGNMLANFMSGLLK